MSVRDIIKALKRLGWTICTTGGGHIKAVPPDGGPFVIMSASPSDYRAGQRALSILRRYGHDLL